MRYVALSFLLLCTFLLTMSAEACVPFPAITNPVTVTPVHRGDPVRTKTVTFGTNSILVTCDGNGFLANTVTNMVLTIREQFDPTGSDMTYTLTYLWYNGSKGTEGGDQEVFFGLFDSAMNPVGGWSSTIDRGHCSYGGASRGGTQFPERATVDVFNQIKYVQMKIGTVFGTQFECK